jgi:S1-C subfamily serine protease
MLKRVYRALLPVALMSLMVQAQSKQEEAQGIFVIKQGNYLGAYLEEVTPERVKELGLKEERGAIVMKVVPGSPAERAGLRENDVIVSFNGRQVESVRELQRLISETLPGRTVSIEVIRGGKPQKLTATLEKRSPGPPLVDVETLEEVLKGAAERTKQLAERTKQMMPSIVGSYTFWSRRSRLGIGVETLTGQLAEYFGVKGGVLITEVREDSPAARAGLRAGDVIVAVETENINDVRDLSLALSKRPEGPVTLRIVRDKREQTITVNLEKPQPARPRSRWYLSPTT